MPKLVYVRNADPHSNTQKITFQDGRDPVLMGQVGDFKDEEVATLLNSVVLMTESEAKSQKEAEQAAAEKAEEASAESSEKPEESGDSTPPETPESPASAGGKPPRQS